jgi:hypothetical protein
MFSSWSMIQTATSYLTITLTRQRTPYYHYACMDIGGLREACSYCKNNVIYDKAMSTCSCLDHIRRGTRDYTGLTIIRLRKKNETQLSHRNYVRGLTSLLSVDTGDTKHSM